MTDERTQGTIPNLTWEKTDEIPPRESPRASRQRMYKQIAEEARKNPGDLYVIRGYSTPVVATNMRKGKYPAINPDEFEIESRRNRDGRRYDVYLRFIGSTEEKK